MEKQTRGKANGNARGKGRGHLDTLATDVESALKRTPATEPGPTARERASVVEQINIPAMRLQTMALTVKAFEDSSLITHRFPHGVLETMLEGKDETKNEKRVLPERIPDEEFRVAMYVLNRKTKRLIRGVSEHAELCAIDYNDKTKWAHVLPMGMFKGALMSAVKYVEGITLQYVKQTLHVFGDFGDFGEILTKHPVQMREDIVKIGPWNNKTPSPRYRPEYLDWSMNIRIRYNEGFLSKKQIASLMQYAGFTAGVAELRPEKSGSTHGMFTCT